MNQPPTNICPLLVISGIGSFERPPAVCLEERCAWWDGLAEACCIAFGADCIREVADQLDALATKSQTFGNLQKEALAQFPLYARVGANEGTHDKAAIMGTENELPGATNTEQLEGGKQVLADTDSTSNDNTERRK